MTRAELEDSVKELEQMQKRQKILEIKKSAQELAVLKELLAANREKIKKIDDNIKTMKGKY